MARVYRVTNTVPQPLEPQLFKTGPTRPIVVSNRNPRKRNPGSVTQVAVLPQGANLGTPTFANPFSADSMWNTPVSTYTNAAAFYGRGDGSTNKPNFAAIPTSGGQGIYCDIEYIYDSVAGGTQNDELWFTPPWPARAPSGPGAGGTVIDSGRVIKLPSGLYVQAFSSGVSVVNSGFGYLDEADTVHHTGVPTWWQGSGYCIDNGGGAGNTTPGLGNSRQNLASCEDVRNDRRGNLGGRGASSLSSVGGCIRLGELDVGGDPSVNYPHHALACIFPMGLYGRQDVPGITPSEATAYGWSSTSSIGTGGFVWPAITQDDGYNGGSPGIGNNYGGSNSNNGTPWVWMGSLLALKPSEFAGILAAMTTQKGRLLAYELLNYGVYIVDNAASAQVFTVFGFMIDQVASTTEGFHGSNTGLDTGLVADTNVLFQNLWVILH